MNKSFYSLILSILIILSVIMPKKDTKYKSAAPDETQDKSYQTTVIYDENVAEKISNKARVLAINELLDDEYTCISENYDISGIIEKSGAILIKENQGIQNLSTIADVNPDIILVSNSDEFPAKNKIDILKNTASLKQVSAIKNNRFVVVELDSINDESNTAEKLAKEFYPGLFQ